ncbi:MAG: TIGR03086 family metal-binding protein [Acidimicrobiia bacterium]
MDLLANLEAAFDHTRTVITGVGPDQLDAPTPCTDWDVCALLGHTIGVVTNMGLGARGEALLPDVNAVAVDADPGAQFAAVAASTLAAWKAADLDGQVDVGAGPMPASIAASINLLDTSTHAWDLARATGQPEELPAGVAAATLELAPQIVSDPIRQFAGFAPARDAGPGATATEQLVAFLGRPA